MAAVFAGLIPAAIEQLRTRDTRVRFGAVLYWLLSMMRVDKTEGGLFSNAALRNTGLSGNDIPILVGSNFPPVVYPALDPNLGLVTDVAIEQEVFINDNDAVGRVEAQIVKSGGTVTITPRITTVQVT